jgi:hypothetical protein
MGLAAPLASSPVPCALSGKEKARFLGEESGPAAGDGRRAVHSPDGEGLIRGALSRRKCISWQSTSCTAIRTTVVWMAGAGPAHECTDA